jgi:hypothetical protein
MPPMTISALMSTWPSFPGLLDYFRRNVFLLPSGATMKRPWFVVPKMVPPKCMMPAVRGRVVQMCGRRQASAIMKPITSQRDWSRCGRRHEAQHIPDNRRRR